MKTLSEELVTLRVSVARIAQAVRCDNKLHITGDSYEQLRWKAISIERGWNELAGIVADWAVSLRTGISDASRECEGPI